MLVNTSGSISSVSTSTPRSYSMNSTNSTMSSEFKSPTYKMGSWSVNSTGGAALAWSSSQRLS